MTGACPWGPGEAGEHTHTATHTTAQPSVLGTLRWGGAGRGWKKIIAGVLLSMLKMSVIKIQE